jgi:hypothetical protein
MMISYRLSIIEFHPVPGQDTANLPHLIGFGFRAHWLQIDDLGYIFPPKYVVVAADSLREAQFSQ